MRHAAVIGKAASGLAPAASRKEGCTQELWRTIKPDVVLHADHDLLRSVLTLDFKFPCPDANRPRWKNHGENSDYANFSQGQVYKDARGRPRWRNPLLLPMLSKEEQSN